MRHNLNMAAPNDISGTAKARVVKFRAQVDHKILKDGSRDPDHAPFSVCSSSSS